MVCASRAALAGSTCGPNVVIAAFKVAICALYIAICAASFAGSNRETRIVNFGSDRTAFSYGPLIESKLFCKTANFAFSSLNWSP